jgi:hypothetical protein
MSGVGNCRMTFVVTGLGFGEGVVRKYLE